MGRLRAWPAILSVVVVIPAVARAQTFPWIRFQDFSSEALCGLVHAANAELVVRADTGQLEIVSGPDVILSDVLVDGNGNVTFEGASAGFIEFAVDGDGDRALFWLTLTGRLVAIGAFDASPEESDTSPGDIRNTGCDPCSQWDDQSICVTDGNSNANGNDNTSGGAVGGLLAGLCGSGMGAAAMLLLIGTLVGRRFRLLRRRSDVP